MPRRQRACPSAALDERVLAAIKVDRLPGRPSKHPRSARERPEVPDSGPCTPPGSPHHYTFVVIGTDFEVKELAPGLTREDFLAKLVPQGGMSRAKGSAGLVGLFVKPAN